MPRTPAIDLEIWNPLCELRAHLDAFAARRAAERAQLDAARPAVESLRQALNRLERAAARGAHQAFHEADWDIHRTIVAAAAVPALIPAWTSVADTQRSFSRRTLDACWPDLAVLAAEHRFLVEAIVSGDVYAAEDAARAHLDAVWYRMNEATRDPQVVLNDRDDPLQRAVAYLAVHYARPVRLELVARAVAGVSSGHLSRLLREQYALGFAAYLQHLRLDKAAELLRCSTQPVARIARRVGYADLSRFAQHFRRRFASAPRDYRQATSEQEVVPASALMRRISPAVRRSRTAVRT